MLIFAGNKDKDLAGMLAVLGPLVEHVYLTRFASPRCVPPEQLVEMIPAERRRHATVCPNASAALDRARADAAPHDVICAAGSVFLAGELRSLLIGHAVMQ